MAGGEALGVARLVARRVRLLVGRRHLQLGGGVVDRRRRRRLIEGVLARRVGRRVGLQVRIFREEERRCGRPRAASAACWWIRWTWCRVDGVE